MDGATAYSRSRSRCSSWPEPANSLTVATPPNGLRSTKTYGGATSRWVAPVSSARAPGSSVVSTTSKP